MAKKRGSSKASTGSLSPSVKKSTKKATKPKKKIAYKQEYIKLLEKTNKTFIKELKAIRKAIEVPSPSKYPEDFEPFPKEDTKRIIPTRKVKAGSIQEQILQELEELNQQVRARDIMFDELVNSPASIRGDYFNG
jgi:RAB protein geranylgeranyltransferase component A